MIKVSRILQAVTWRQFVHGEYWLLEDGSSEFADGDTGDKGHEQIAVDAVLEHYSDRLDKAFILYFQHLPHDPQHPEDYEGQRDHYRRFFSGPDPDDFSIYNGGDEGGLSDLFYNERIPDEVGRLAMGADLWQEFRQDIRKFYAKHFNAAHVINNHFSVWKLTPRMIDAIQGFILEQADENGLDSDSPLPGSVHIEEASTRRYTEVEIAEFLTMRQPGQVFAGTRAFA